MDITPEIPPSVRALEKILSDLPQDEDLLPTPELIEALKKCWECFQGNDMGKMHAGKLDRIEKVRWSPPELSFWIERHGAIFFGSIRAEIQQWDVDLKNLVTGFDQVGTRQKFPRDKPLNTQKLAEEIAQLILNQKKDPRLKWLTPSKVRIQIGEAIPETVKQTTSGRRKRFSKQITPLLEEAGWVIVEGTWPHTYERIESATPNLEQKVTPQS